MRSRASAPNGRRGACRRRSAGTRAMAGQASSRRPARRRHPPGRRSRPRAQAEQHVGGGGRTAAAHSNAMRARSRSMAPGPRARRAVPAALPVRLALRGAIAAAARATACAVWTSAAMPWSKPRGSRSRPRTADFLRAQHAARGQPVESRIEGSCPASAGSGRRQAARQRLRRFDARHPAARPRPLTPRGRKVLRKRHQDDRIAQRHLLLPRPRSDERHDARPRVAATGFKSDASGVRHGIEAFATTHDSNGGIGTLCQNHCALRPVPCLGPLASPEENP